MEKKNLILIVLLIFGIGFGLWLNSLRTRQPADVVVTMPVQTSDNPQKISKDVEGIDIGDLDSEFQSIDADLNNL